MSNSRQYNLNYYLPYATTHAAINEPAINRLLYAIKLNFVL